MYRFIVDNETVTDSQTGLMWTKNASLLDFPMTWEEALNAAKKLNTSCLYGYTNWKIPNRRELFSLLSYNAINPSLPKAHPFTNVFTSYYWTSSTCSRLPDQAWYIHFGGARVVKGKKTESAMVWPVRWIEENSDAISENFLETGPKVCFNEAGSVMPRMSSDQNKNLCQKTNTVKDRFVKFPETIYDNATDLMWLRNANLYINPVDWRSAITLISEMNTLNTGGYNDWRVPNILELESLVDLGQHSPALPPDHPFTNIQDFYWSATTSAYEQNYAWVLYVIDGMVGVGYKSLPEFYLWPVRGKKNLQIQ